MDENFTHINIGMFDSGIGGFSVLQEIHKLLPSVNIHYIADKLYMPYGEKEQSFLINRAREVSKLLIEKNVSLIVVACNTATAVSIKSLREIYSIPFVGIEPYLNVYNREKDVTENSKIGVLTTPVTASSNKYIELKNRLDPNGKIFHHSSNKLANLIEKIYFKDLDVKTIKQIEIELTPLKGKGFTHIILGCTHYPLISSIIEKFLDVQCISPGPYVATRVKDLLEKKFTKNSINLDYVNDFLFLDTTLDKWIKFNHKQVKNLSSMGLIGN